jgi:hypothetical protein
MSIIKHFAFRLHVLSLALLFSTIAFAQEAQKPVPKPQPANVPITVAAVGERVRFTAIGAVERMRLEVFDASGQTVFDTGFKPGNVSDWRLVDTHGQRLLDGTYQCAVTVRELTGRLSFKQGSILIQAGRASQALDGGGQSGTIETEQALSERNSAEPSAMTVVAHDGEDGQVTSTAGDLTFRTGDVFSGKDKERMRLTEDGKLGIGTKNPQATLDVAGTVRASKGVTFPDGTVLTSATGRPQKLDANGEPEPVVGGSGTMGKLAKWIDSFGTLGDSVVTESPSGRIGIGTASPNSKLHVRGAVEIGATSGPGVNPTLINPNAIANIAQVRFYPASGTDVNTSFAVVPKGAGLPNNKAQFSILATDSVANPNNVEFVTFRARNNDFILSTGKTGAGLDKPLVLSAGHLTDNVTNNNQIFLATGGNVGVGTNNPTAKLHVNGNVQFAGLRTEANVNSPNIIGGFSGNTVTAGVVGATIGGGGGSSVGNFNHVTDNFGTVSGGFHNRAGDFAGTVTDRPNATVGGGQSNTASGSNSTVGGGSTNQANGTSAIVGGGSGNAANGNFSTVGGGLSNVADSRESTVGGGQSNFAGDRATVGGGFDNSALGQYSTVGGGTTNVVGSVSATIGGGSSNTIDLGIDGTIGGGVSNLISAGRATIGGGFQNEASGFGSTIPGGSENLAEGFFSFAAGNHAQARHDATFVWSGNPDVSQPDAFASTGDGQFLIKATGGVGINTNAPAASLHVAGGDIFVSSQGNGLVTKSPNGSCWRITVSNAGALTAASVTCP